MRQQTRGRRRELLDGKCQNRGKGVQSVSGLGDSIRCILRLHQVYNLRLRLIRRGINRHDYVVICAALRRERIQWKPAPYQTATTNYLKTITDDRQIEGSSCWPIWENHRESALAVKGLAQGIDVGNDIGKNRGDREGAEPFLIDRLALLQSGPTDNSAVALSLNAEDSHYRVCRLTDEGLLTAQPNPFGERTLFRTPPAVQPPARALAVRRTLLSAVPSRSRGAGLGAKSVPVTARASESRACASAGSRSGGTHPRVASSHPRARLVGVWPVRAGFTWR